MMESLHFKLIQVLHNTLYHSHYHSTGSAYRAVRTQEQMQPLYRIESWCWDFFYDE